MCYRAACDHHLMVQVWFDPLTKKRFSTENTYQAHVNSKKYKELLKKLGKETPAPVVSIKRPDGLGKTPLQGCLLQYVCLLQ